MKRTERCAFKRAAAEPNATTHGDGSRPWGISWVALGAVWEAALRALGLPSDARHGRTPYVYAYHADALFRQD
ncbi:hypothetical protein VTN02DRAFT_245 [Thermoascus thermophilus]